MKAEEAEVAQARLLPFERPTTEIAVVVVAKATLLAVDAPPPADLCLTEPIKYRQQADMTCLIDSFCSAMWAFGLTEAAQGLQDHYRAQLNQSNHRLIGEWIQVTNQHYLHRMQLVIRKLPRLCMVDDILAWDTSWPLVVLLMTSDGGVGQHSVTIYRDGIYEPNSAVVLTKSRGSLDWASGDGCTASGS